MPASSSSNDQPVQKEYTSMDGQSESERESQGYVSPFRNQILGVILSAIASLLFQVTTTCAQIINKTVPYAELNTFRFLFQPIFALIFLFTREHNTKKFSIAIPQSQIKWVLMFAILTNYQSLAYYTSLYYIPPGVSFAISAGTSMIASWLVILVLFRRFWPHMMLATGVCLLSLLFVSQPEQIHTWADSLQNLTQHTRLHQFWDCRSVCMPQNGNHSICNALLLKTTSAQHIDCMDLLTKPMHEINEHEISLMTNKTFNSKNISETYHSKLPEWTDSGGYLLATLAALCLTSYCYILNINLADIDMVTLNIWVPLINIIVSTIQMFITETPQLPGCWFCVLMIFTHMLTSSLGTMALWGAVNLVDPIIMFIINMSLQIPISNILQITILKDITFHDENTIAYVGIILAFIGLLLGPIQELYFRYSSYNLGKIPLLRDTPTEEADNDWDQNR